MSSIGECADRRDRIATQKFIPLYEQPLNCGYRRGMANRVERSVNEVELLSPNERAELLNDSVVSDLAQIDPEFLAKAREKGRRLMAERSLLNPAQQ